MSTLLLRLAAPMQSWGFDSKYNTRRTGREPTKSGVLGMAAAALGYRRDDRAGIERLCRLRFGVRVDREGTLLRDYQTVHRTAGEDVYITYRDYLCDAVFTAGLEGDKSELEELERAFQYPAYPLFLGRRSCPPVGRFCLGIVGLPLKQALEKAPPYKPYKLYTLRKADLPSEFRMVLDDENGEKQVQDLPISYSPMKREYAYRNICEEWVAANAFPEHDPMAEL